MKKELNLSDKVKPKPEAKNGKWFFEEDVKEFIRLLRERKRKYFDANGKLLHWVILEEDLNELAGDNFKEDASQDKSKFKTTFEERRIIDKLDCHQIERWAINKEFWKIYQVVIKATKFYLNQDKKGCGKVFYMTERVGKRRSGHQCTCGNNKWGYLCDKCQDQDKGEKELYEQIKEHEDKAEELRKKANHWTMQEKDSCEEGGEE